MEVYGQTPVGSLESPVSLSLDVVDPATFHRRLTALEAWLFEEGWRAHRREAPPDDQQLADAAQRLSDLYTLQRHLIGRSSQDDDILAARVLYYLCSDAPKMYLVLHELSLRRPARRDARADSLRIADFGAGVGTSCAALLLSLNAASHSAVSIFAVDQDEAALAWLRPIVTAAAAIADIRAEIIMRVADALSSESLRTAASTDLVLMQTMLNETVTGPESDAAIGIADGLHPLLASTTTVIIEPALRITTRPLHQLRDELLARGGVQVVAPCPHQRVCPMLANERDWCHEIRMVPPTPRVDATQRVSRRRDERVKFSFLVTEPTQPAIDPAIDETAPLGGRLVSDALNSKGKMERFLCNRSGDLVLLRLLDKHRTPSNAPILSERGTLVAIHQPEPPPRVQPGALVAVTINAADPSMPAIATV